MRLFQRIFATFCMVIVCAIFVASLSFWVVQQKLAENQFKQLRNMEISLLGSAITALQVGGQKSVRDLLERWATHPASRRVMVITGDNKQDILGRRVSPEEIDQAYQYAVKNPGNNLAVIHYDPFGEEYLFFIRYFDRAQMDRMPSPLRIPGLPLAPIWHELIILVSTLLVGLLLAYILANNITQPIRVLENAMNRLALGDLDTRVGEQLDERKDELANLGAQFDKMAVQLKTLVEKERHLLHHVSHEMRSPLARIQAIVGLLQAQPQNQEKYIARLESELTRMDVLVGELLTLSRLETANMPMNKEPVAIVEFMEQIVEDSQSVACKLNHTVELEVKNIHANAQMDINENYLYRAFDNVIRNAMNYSPEGSKIKVLVYEDRKHLNIEVIDNGMGIKEEQLPKIFDAFYRADSSNGKTGTGLGLAITKHIVEQHNGELIAQNVQPNGLKMHFIFPKTTKSKQKDKPKDLEQIPDES